MIIQQLLKLCSCECATGASLRPSTITGVYGDEVPPVLIPNTEVKLIRADGTWLDTCPGEYVDAGFQKKKLARLCEFFLLQKMCEKSTPRGKVREGADSFVKNAERLNGLHFSAAERSDCAQGKTAPLPRCGRREAQITTRRRRFPKQKHSTSVGCFCFVHDGNDFPWTAKQRSAEGKSATVRIVLLKRGVRKRKDFAATDMNDCVQRRISAPNRKRA